MKEHAAFWLLLTLLGLALVLSACAPGGGSSRECSFVKPLVFSHKSIAGLDPDDARALLANNRAVAAVCG